jgi:hypothetical protein
MLRGLDRALEGSRGLGKATLPEERVPQEQRGWQREVPVPLRQAESFPECFHGTRVVLQRHARAPQPHQRLRAERR